MHVTVRIQRAIEKGNLYAWVCIHAHIYMCVCVHVIYVSMTMGNGYEHLMLFAITVWLGI